MGGHVVRELLEAGHDVRVTYRDERRLNRLGALEPEPVKADLFDRAAMRRAVRGCDQLFHVAGFVGSRPPDRAWQVNALGPRRAVEAAAAEDVQRVVVTSSVAGLGPVAPGAIGTEEDPFRGGALGLVYPDSKHEGELEALAAAARLGIEVVVVNPSYVLGVPVDRSQPGETSTRLIGNYLRGRLPAVVDGRTDFSDVRDVARGHLRAAERGKPGRALRPRRPRQRLGGADRAGRRAVGRAPPGRGAAAACWGSRGRARRGAAPARPDRLRGDPADGPELELLLAQGARRAGLPHPPARVDRARHRRLVPRADRRRRPGRAASRRCRWAPRACAWPAAPG